MSQKPELKISVVDVDDRANRVDLFAFWRRDDGKLSGDLDRRIRGLRIVLDDGTKVDVYRKDGKKTHWINCYEESVRPNGPRDTPRDDRGWGDDDDIPF